MFLNHLLNKSKAWPNLDNMTLRKIALAILVLSPPITAETLSSLVNSNTCSAVYEVSPNCSAARGEGEQLVNPLGEVVSSESLSVINPSTMVIELNDYHYTQAKLRATYNSRVGTEDFRGCVYDVDYGMIYKESFKWEPEVYKVKGEYEKLQTLKHSVFTTTRKNGRCTRKQVDPRWDNASTNYDDSSKAKVDEAITLYYTNGALSKSSSVMLVDRVEPFIYYK